MRALRFFVLLCSAILACAGCAGSLPRPDEPLRGLSSTDTAVTCQVIEVVPSGKKIFQAVLTGWAYDKGAWRKTLGPWPAVIGRGGLAPVGEKREGDGRTPSGVYRIGTAFGTEDLPDTEWAYRRTTDADIWIDDAGSPQYNQWAALPTSAASYEKMRRDDGLYDLAAVIEYNTNPVVPGYGSAIFLHIWRADGTQPTAGCVAIERKRMRRLLGWLSEERAPVIFLHE